MRGVVRIGLGVLALIALCPFPTFAGLVEEPVPSADLEAIFSVPVETPTPVEALPADTQIFLSSADGSIDDTIFNACCRAANASCSAVCGGDVRRFECTRVGSSGCSSYCECNYIKGE